MTIGQKIRRLRTSAGLSQAELARMIGKTRSMVSQYESDMHAPRMGTVEKLAVALRCSKSEIVDDFTLALDDPGECELVTIYRNMDKRARTDLLTIARSLSASISDLAEKSA